MATITLKADALLLKPGVFVGRHPDTGVLHRLTIKSTGKIIIERKPYVSSCADHWRQTYETITDEADNHLFLILKIKQNPVDIPY